MNTNAVILAGDQRRRTMLPSPLMMVEKGGESQSRNPATATIAENLAIGQGTAGQKAVAKLAKAHKGRAREKTRKRTVMARARVAERRKGRRLQQVLRPKRRKTPHGL